MKKSEYMDILKDRLSRFSQELQEEILEDYNQHFAEGEKQGKSEEEIIQELGNIEEMIGELAEVDSVRGQENSKNRDSHRDEVLEKEQKYCYEGAYRAIQLECDVADIVLEPSENGRIQVDYKNTGSDEYCRCFTFYQHEKDGVFYAGVKREKERKVKFFGRTVTVNTNGAFGNFGNGGRVILTVKVPREMPLLSFLTSSGNARAEGIQVHTLQGNTASGNLTVRKALVQKLETSTASGNLTIAEVVGTTLEASSASGNLKASEVKAKEISFSTASGGVSVKGARAETAELNAASGSIRMDADVKDCRCNTASGSMDICIAGKARRIDISAASGHAGLKLENAGGMEADIQTMSGSVNISWAGEGQKHVKGGTYRYGDGSCQVNVNVMSGSVHIVGR